MSNFKQTFLALVIIAVAAPVFAIDMGESQGHDLDALWAAAQKNFDTETEDAVLLLESRRITVNGDGTKSTRVHTVVWITSSVGIRGYADLRIPWDTATSELEVEVLRTWMDDRWWPDVERISDTAVVHTLPHALRTAHDYTTMRETMLLHDGVELPCIMETVYTITETMAFDHTDGLMLTSGVEVMHEAVNGAPQPVVANADGQLVMSWTMDNVDRLKLPVTAAPARYEPAVVWSTWPSWEAANTAWKSSLESVAVLSPALEDSLHGMVVARSGIERKMKFLADWVNDMVRPVGYGSRFWFGRARPAGEVFETGYGHPLDRAVLFSALYMQTREDLPIFFVGEPGEPVAPGVPRLGGLGTLMVGHPMQETLYDATHGRLVNSVSLRGRLAAFLEDEPVTLAPLTNVVDGWTMHLALEQGDEGAWKGEGGHIASGVFGAYTEMADGANAAADHLGGVVVSTFPSAEMIWVNPIKFGGEGQSFKLAFDLPALEPDESGLTRMVIGPAGGGILSRLPRDVHVGEDVRTSPVIGLPLFQTLRVRIRVENLTGPDPVMVENEVGMFTLEVFEEDGWTMVVRELHLKKGRIEPDEWPALRALLLEDQDPRHGTIIFE
jgi:hypothetical protein